MLASPMILTAPSWSDIQLSYGIVPPKISSTQERRQEIAGLQVERISALPIDALVVYDLQDESSRTEQERPFPFLESVDPLTYAYEYLDGITHPKIVYRSVSGQTEESLTEWMLRLKAFAGAAVFVGAPSDKQKVSLRLGDAYKLRRRVASDLPLGGVTIAERHEAIGAEDERILKKVSSGCQFFISQAVYSVTASKNMPSDLALRCEREQRAAPKILVTLSPCGSQKTLEFMQWLGVSVPRWLQNELLGAHDILQKSVDLSVGGFQELYQFAKEKGINLGCNIESVSVRKAEIDASVEMVHRVATILGRKEEGASV